MAFWMKNSGMMQSAVRSWGLFSAAYFCSRNEDWPESFFISAYNNMSIERDTTSFYVALHMVCYDYTFIRIMLLY